MNRSISGILYLFGLIFTLFNNALVSSFKKSHLVESNRNMSDLCYVGIPFVSARNLNSSPNMALIIYSLCYFLAPIFLKNMFYLRNPFGFIEFMLRKNLFLLIFFAFIIGLNIVVETKLECSDPLMHGTDFINGALVGLFSGWLYTLIFYVSGNKNALIKHQFLGKTLMCETSKSVIFRCDNKIGSKNYIKFTEEPPYGNGKSSNGKKEEIYSIGDPDLYILSTIKMYKDYKHVHIFGKTSLVIYRQENYKGEKFLISYDDLYKENENESNTKYISISKSKLEDKCYWAKLKNESCNDIAEDPIIGSIQLINEE